jgi:hypothetical protein
MAETMASPAPQKIVGTANPSFTSDFCNKIGQFPTWQRQPLAYTDKSLAYADKMILVRSLAVLHAKRAL